MIIGFPSLDLDFLPKIRFTKSVLTNLFNSTVIEVYKDIIRICQRTGSCQQFMYIAAILIKKGRINNDPTFFLISIRTEEFVFYMRF